MKAKDIKSSIMLLPFAVFISLFVYSCSGGGGGSSNSSPQPTNSPPQPIAQGIGIRMENTGFSQVNANDPDADQVHSYEITTPPTVGTATINGEGVITYIPEQSFIGSDSLVVTVTDNGVPPMSGTVTAKIMVFDILNFVLVITDDQRWDTLWAMPIVMDKLSQGGVTFTNAFVTSPICCPSRASLLSGGFYAHNTSVLDNIRPNGGAAKFNDADTLATSLQSVGYKTGHIGMKYLNEYARIAPYIPPGWTRFINFNRPAVGQEWTDYTVAKGSSTWNEPSNGELLQVSQYMTDFLKDEALKFIDDYADSPFFLYFSPMAPHYPAIPAQEDANLFSDYVYRDRAYGETDVSDKPPILQAHSPGYWLPTSTV